MAELLDIINIAPQRHLLAKNWNPLSVRAGGKCHALGGESAVVCRAWQPLDKTHSSIRLWLIARVAHSESFNGQALVLSEHFKGQVHVLRGTSHCAWIKTNPVFNFHPSQCFWKFEKFFFDFFWHIFWYDYLSILVLRSIFLSGLLWLQKALKERLFITAMWRGIWNGKHRSGKQ